MPDYSYNNQQLGALLQMQDLTSDEKAIAEQQARSKALRDSVMRGGKMDFGSQAARGMQGIEGALRDYQSSAAIDDYKKKKAGTLQQVQQMLMGGSGGMGGMGGSTGGTAASAGELDAAAGFGI